MTFYVPWVDAPVISRSTPGNLFTFFHFAHNHKIVEVFASSTSLSPLVNGGRTAYLNGLADEGSTTLRVFAALFPTASASDYDFVSSSLNSTPHDLSLNAESLCSSLFVATGFLEAKKDLFHVLGEDSLPVGTLNALYYFSTSMVKGYDFSGTFTVGSTTYPASHFLVFDGRDVPFNLLTVGATQEENSYILATLKVK